MEKHLKEKLNSIFEKDSVFILGVSGGPDSMALLYLFRQLSIPALVSHINYGLRGEESTLDQELVEELCFEWGFECNTIHLDVNDAEINNFQNWARKQRYQVFEDLLKANGAAAIATAHHRDDQVETIFQKLLRGSAPSAWQGMKVWDGRIFRPLLPFSKEEILAFCESESIPYRIDKSNLKSGYARNFIRAELAEKMDDFFPGWKDNILELSNRGQLYKEAINFVSDSIVDGNKINLDAFSNLSDSLKPAVLKNIQENKSRMEITTGELKELLKIEQLQTGKWIEAGGLKFIRDRDTIVIQDIKEEPGKTEYQISREEAGNGMVLEGIKLAMKNDPVENNQLYLDGDKLSWPVTLRSWEAGDRFTPLGMSGSQKISDHLTNRKISAHLKGKALLLCGSDGTIYAIIYPEQKGDDEPGAISEFVKCTGNTKEYLTINFT